jgi:hypothetical protein
VTLLAAGTLLAQSGKIDGTWTGQMLSPVSEPAPMTLVFKTAGASVTGHLVTEEGKQLPLQDVVLEGNKLSFWYSLGQYDMIVNGVTSDKELKLKAMLDVIGITFDVTLTRKK